MKKLIAAASFAMFGLFAYAGAAPASSPELAPLASSAQPDVESDGVTGACPSYAPKCCAYVNGRCLQCVGRLNECP